MNASQVFWRRMLILGLLLMGLRALNIAYVLQASNRDGIDYYHGPDTGSNIANSLALFDERPLAPIFRERIVYPFLLGVARMAGIGYRHVLWLNAFLEVPSVLAMAYLGWVLTRRKAVAALGAMLYALNPNGYQLSAVLMPDWMNGQVMLMAVAAIMGWAVGGSRRSGWAACFLVPLTQMIRPTLFLVIVPLILLLWKGFWARERRVINAALCASVLVYPAINYAINATVYGVPTLLLSSGYQLHHCYVSYVRALQRNAEQPQSMRFLYFDEKHNVQLADPREVITGAYRTTPIPDDFAVHYTSLVESSKQFLKSHPGLWLKANYDGIYRQLFYPPSFHPPGGRRLYPAVSGLMRKVHTLALFFSFCGVWLLIRKLPLGVTLFYAGCTGFIVLASGAAWHDTVRVRLLVDMIYTPILAVGLLSLPAWLCLGGWMALAYGPRRLLNWPPAYVPAASVVVMIASALFLLRSSLPDRDPAAPGPPG